MKNPFSPAFVVSLLAIILLLVPALALGSELPTEQPSTFFDNLSNWLIAITSVIAALLGVAALTRTKKDDKILGKLLNVLRFLSDLFRKTKK